MAFDPAKYGATLVKEPAQTGTFDPSKYGAVRVEERATPSEAPTLGQIISGQKDRSVANAFGLGADIVDVGVGAAKGAISTAMTAPRKVSEIFEAIGKKSISKNVQQGIAQVQSIADRQAEVYKNLPDSDPRKEIAKQALLDAAKQVDMLAKMNPTSPNSATSQMLSWIEPKNTAQTIGFTGEKIAEFVAGTGKGSIGIGDKTTSIPALTNQAGEFVSKSSGGGTLGSILGKATEIGTRAGLTGTGALLTSSAQGEKIEDSAKIGAGVGAFEAVLGTTGLVTNRLLATKPGQAIVKWLTEKIPSRLINSIIRPAEKDFSFGKNPGLGVAEEGITANTRGGLVTQINQKRKTVGSEIENLITKPENAQKILNVEDAITTPIQEAKRKAIQAGEQGLYNRLVELENGLTKEFIEQEGKLSISGSKNLQGISPKDAQGIKFTVEENTRWTDQAFDNDINKVRVQIYRNLDNMLDDAVPGIDALNSRYANLLTAQSSLTKRNKQLERLVLLGLRSTGVGTTIGVGSAVSGDSGVESVMKGLIAAGAFNLFGSTAVKSRVASYLNSLGNSQRETLFELYPTLRNVYLGVRANDINELKE